MLRRIESLDKKIENSKTQKDKIKYLKQREETVNNLKILSEDIHMLSQMSEIETLKIFKNKVRRMISEEEFIKLCIESEEQYLEDNTFNFYDLAIQNYNHFNNL